MKVLEFYFNGAKEQQNLLGFGGMTDIVQIQITDDDYALKIFKDITEEKWKNWITILGTKAINLNNVCWINIKDVKEKEGEV